MGMGLRTKLYNIGGDPLTQLILLNYFFFIFFLKINADSEKMNEKYFVGDPLTHLGNQADIPA